MIIRNLHNWSPYTRFTAAFFAGSSFVLVTLTLHYMGNYFYSAHSYKLYFFAAILITFFFGALTASIYTLCASIYANLYFAPQFGVFSIMMNELERFSIHFIFVCAGILFIEILQRQRFKSKLLLLVSESRYLSLLRRDNQILQYKRM